MNRSFRLVWNAAIGLWVVASEAAKGKHKNSSSGRILKLKPNLLGSLLFVGIGLMPLSNVQAANLNWEDGADGAWNNADNWVDPLAPTEEVEVPSEEDNAAINNGTVRVSGGAKAASLNLVIANNSSTEASFMVSGEGSSLAAAEDIYVGYGGNGTLTVSDGGEVLTDGTLYLGNFSGSEGEVMVSGGGSSLAATGDIYVGYRSSATLAISDGGEVSTDSSLSIGRLSGSEGEVTVSGEGSVLSAAGEIYVGNGGNGTLTVSDGGKVSTDDYLYLGYTQGSEGETTVSGEGSSLAATRNIYIGYQGNGTLTVSDGGKVATDITLFLGLFAGSEGEVTVSGEKSSLASVVDIFVGYHGSATMTVSDGGKVATDITLFLGRFSDSEGTVNIGAAQGEAAAVAGTLAVGDAIAFGDGTGTLVLNHTNTDYVVAADIKGGTTSNSNINLLHGTTRFTGDLTQYTGNMNVQGGTLSIAAGDTLTLGGDYDQTDGVLQIGASSASNLGGLSVDGTATFATDSAIYVNAAGAKGLTVGANLGRIISAGTLDSDGFLVTDNSALFDFAVSVNNNTVDLNVTQGTDSTGGKVTLLKYVEDQQFKTGLGAASVLNGFVNGTATGNGMDEVVSGLGKMATAKDVADAVAQTLPLMSGSSAKASTSVMQANSNVVSARQSGLSSGDGFITDKHAWVKPVGSLAKQDARNGVSGFDASTFGIIGGLDGDLNDTTSIGFALSYMRTSLDGSGTNSTNSADIDAYQAIAYGQHQFGEDFHNLDLSWQAAIGFNQTDGTRRITFMDSTAKSNYDSYTSNLSVGLGRTFAMDSDTSVTPSVRAAYSYIKDDSYQESGAGALNLDVAGNTTDALVISVNGDFSRRIDDQTALLVSAGIGYDLLNDASSSTASFAGGGAAFTTNGLELSPVVITAGVGVNYALNDATDITVRYDLEGRSDFLSQTASAKVTWVF